MKIKDIIKDKDLKFSVYGSAGINIIGISNDSRKIKKGYLFAAKKGVNVDSNIYIEEAIRNGASAILTGDVLAVKKFEGSGVSVIIAKAPLKAYAVISRNFFGNPAERLNVIGVTGTNGKTTVTFLIRSILNAAGHSAGLIGTIGYEIGGRIIESKNTTPDPYELNKMFSDIALTNGAAEKSCVMEVSSHSLAQDRVYGIPFDVAVFTNLTRDHLDYHKSMKRYFEAKKKLFTEILLKSGKAEKFAVINNDDYYGKILITELKDYLGKVKVLAYGLDENCGISAHNINYYRDGLKFDIILPDNNKIKSVRSNLIGSYNVYNILAAVSAAYALSVPLEYISEGIESLSGVPGRIEKVSTGSAESPLICIDYAHTDDALKRVLSVLRNITETGKLISVFGCGGDRDKGKRPLMGEHSTTIADISIITSDNPRSEDPLSIIKEIESGIKDAKFADKKGLGGAAVKRDGHVYTVEEDRTNAIKLALSVATDEDTVLIAGKGHEDYMIVKENKFHFSDREEVLKYYNKIKTKNCENRI